MKTRIALFLLILMMFIPAVVAAGSTPEISLSLSKTVAAPGDSVTASGTTSDTWVPLKVVTEGKNIIVFDAVKADANGNYNITFHIPATASGTLTVVVGEGNNVATGIITVGSDQLYGDVNGDGLVDIDDALLIARYDAQLVTLTEQQLAVADVNGDGSVDIDDALLIAQYDAQIIIVFPVNN